MRNCRFLSSGLFFCVFIFGITAYSSAGTVAEYKGTWEYEALQLQSKIDFYAPLGKAAFITTHNSYNAGVYSQNGSYADPNHKISIYDQLEIGVRAIELDVHYVFSTSGYWPWEWTFSEELKLCHGNGNIGCHPNDRYFTQGLGEIRNWINNNPNEVLIIYIENHMEGEYDKAISEMNGIIGDLIYKPNGCQSLPMNISKSDVINAGKQILIIGGNCATTNWSNYAFNGHFSASLGHENLLAYPDCSCSGKDADYMQNNLVRMYEDSTKLSAMFGDPGPRIEADDAAKMAECGIGAIGLDQIIPFDSRLEAQIWSWGENEPNNAGEEDCAIQRSDGRFNDVSCSGSYYAACQDPATGDWSITNDTYTWDQASSACSAMGMNFSVPVNGYQNALLQDIKSDMNIGEIWLNYSDKLNEGNWMPGF
ncbi:MAG: hypothetical protein GY795_39535 [Desulfobacterales bacterium]|nr:hypothetical protein [Desulfobacterales bacterium]